jgi:hypothetical protein
MHGRGEYEWLSVALKKFKARPQNACLKVSNLVCIPENIAWETAKRGIVETKVKSAYSSRDFSILWSFLLCWMVSRSCGHGIQARLLSC